MQQYAQLFCNYMDETGIKYTVKKDHVILVSYSGENMESIPIYVFFDEDNDPFVQLKCWDILNFKNKGADALIVCNSLNAEYRWLKFFLDKDEDIVASLDAIVDTATCGEECMGLVRRFVNILDEAYPQIAKARWV